jgi:hypothetical protein
MIDYKNLLYEDYIKLLDQIGRYNRLYKSLSEKIRFRLRYSIDIGTRDLTITTAHKEILTKNIIIKNYWNK